MSRQATFREQGIRSLGQGIAAACSDPNALSHLSLASAMPAILGLSHANVLRRAKIEAARHYTYRTTKETYREKHFLRKNYCTVP